MFKVIRWSITLLMVLVVGAFVAAQFITLNQFKELAVQKVREATGRNLDIAGDIKVSFYPVLGAKIDGISLSNRLGADQASMVSVEQLLVGVKVMPLLEKRVELDKIILNKPVVYLEKDAGGKGNWEFAKKEQAETSGVSGGGAAAAVILSGVQITDATLSYSDAKTGSKTEITKLNANVVFQDITRPLKITASAEFQGQPVSVNFDTDSPQDLMTSKGSATYVDAVFNGLPVKLQGKAAVTPERITVSDLEVAVMKAVAKGKVDAVLGGVVPVVNATLDFGTVDIDALKTLAGGAAAGAGATAAPTSGAKKARYVDASIFKSVDGSFALSAESVYSSSFKVVQPKFKANMAGGIWAVAAAGQYASKQPMNIVFQSEDLAAIFAENGGQFALKTISPDKNIAASGNLALLPGKIALKNLNANMNEQSVSGRLTLTEKDGDQALDAELLVPQGGREWQIDVRTPALTKFTEPSGAPLELILQSGTDRFELKANVTSVDKVLKMNPLGVITNGGTGKGSMTYDQTGDVPMLTLNMGFAALDLNPLLAFAQGTSNAATATNDAPAAQNSNAPSPLKSMNADIVIKADKFKAKNVQLSDVNLTADIKSGVLNVNMQDAGLYQGKTSLRAKMDGNTAEPAFSLVTEGSNVNIGAMLKDATGGNTFAGIGTWKADITGAGTKPPAMYNTLGGKGEFSLADGVVRGMDLFTLMSAAKGKFGGSESFIQTTDETNKMNAKGTFTIENGVIKNDDLVVQSPNLEASGRGAVSLPQWQIDYRFDPKVGERRKAGEGEKFVGQSIPVFVQGSIDKPRVFPDPKALVGTGIDALKSIKEFGIGDKVKGVEKYLAPFGLGGTQKETAPEANTETIPQQQQPVVDPIKDPLGALEKFF